jgi:hypothetical protein
VQIWASQPDKFLLRFRPADTNALIYQEYTLGNLSFSPTSPGDTLYARFIEGDANPTPYQITWNLASLQSHEKDIELKITGEEQIAGRRAIVVELYDQEKRRAYRLWVDAITGMILRRLIYSPSSPEVVLWEEQFTAIVYDQAFPPEIFNPVAPPAVNFARDASGVPLPAGQDLPRQPTWPANGHTRLPRLAPPPGFDPSRQPVFVQWPERWENPDSQAGSPDYISTLVPTRPESQSPTGNPSLDPLDEPQLSNASFIEVYASRYFLGNLPLRNVTFESCQRSPDGKLIALSVSQSTLMSSPIHLYWFNVESPQTLHSIDNIGSTFDLYTFSPDSTRLAFYACGSPDCSIEVEMLETRERLSIKRGWFGTSFLAFSPDGKSLALITHSYETTFKVFDLQTREEIYSAPYNYPSGEIPPDSPAYAWGMSLDPRDSWEMGCMNP